MKKPSVIIVGGGFAGLACARELPSKDFAVTLIDRKSSFEFLPNIHELVSGVKKPKQVQLPFRSNLRAAGHRFVQGDVVAIDPDARRVTLEAQKHYEADYLVIALGSKDADYGVSGVSQHSYGFKSVAQCQAIHKRLNALSRSGGKVVIIGGGLEGIEALGEMLRRYRDTPLKLTLVEARDQLLPGGPQAVGELIARHCEDWEVECVMADPVERITAKTVLLSSGRRLRSDLTIWTGGPAPPPLLASSGLADAECWAPVDAFLSHPGYRNVYVAGDAAEPENPISKQAYHALDMGRLIGENIQRQTKRKRLRRYKPSPKPTLLAFGDIDSVLISDKLTLAGPPLGAAKELVFATVIADLDMRPGKVRLNAVVRRGKQATEQLLWPTLSNWRALKKQTQVRKLS
ncbi:NAD(P)/FAD-dependent oxidoreductase [Congregibacter litoralis]|uniref:NADH dehydrogenase, FAD-containing subunit n=1 Tax=Congregibacter litoralis KT71 TaxID=314285 RepID=A4A7H9_9GAMM|nr:FAD-dependent oxidoreductase [Congregibacter litoralis]EAQ98248.1 NADH dehydrogenase, FAD-containing subunit [Congregibacter litoralis KT71]